MMDVQAGTNGVLAIEIGGYCRLMGVEKPA